MNHPSNPYREPATVTPSETQPKEGDVVVLKSGGGPKMTIERIVNERAYCVFFLEDKISPRHLEFNVCTLRLADWI